MNNVLYITVGEFRPLNQTEGSIVVLASDAYGCDYLSFDTTLHLKTCYPTKEELIAAVLTLSAFNGAAVVNSDGTYELDAVSSVIVEGYPE